MAESNKYPKYFTLDQMAAFYNMDDSINPEFTFKLTDSKILSMIVKDEIDPKAMAWKELADRGLDHCGEWVGYDQARRIFESSVCQYIRM